MDDTEQIASFKGGSPMIPLNFFSCREFPNAAERNCRRDFELLSQYKVIGYLQFSWSWNL